MARTVAEINADLSKVRSALELMITGQRVTKLQLGSGEFARLYEFQEISYETLKGIEGDLVVELSEVQQSDTPIFRKNCNIPVVVTKFRR